MDDKELKKLDNTLIKERIDKIIELYDKLEKKQKKFCETFNIHCISGCGECCKHFTPDITEAEALFLAYGLIKDGLDSEVLKTLELNKNSSSCPLYNNDSIFHCSVYKYRPLVCRLFSSAATCDKNENIVYRKCKYNSEGHDITTCEFKSMKVQLF